MITRNEKAKGLWWRLLATLPVLALLLIANTKVAAQEKDAENKPITVEMGAFELYNDDGFPIQLKDTVIYNEDGSYVKCETSDTFDPISGEPRKKMTITTHNADGIPTDNMDLHWEIEGDVTRYIAEPFSITSGESLLILTEGLSALGATANADTVYTIVDQMPQFPGGEQALMDFVSKNVKYPEEAKNKNIAGRVFVSFVVEKDGSINEVKVLRGIGGGCDEEAVRVIKSMPKWKPGKQKGQPVRVNFQMPFVFKLDESAASKSGLVNNVYTGTATGTKDGVSYTMKMTMEFESNTAGYFVMTLTSQKKNGKPQVEFEDVGLPFTYTFDGKSSGSIQPTNPDGSQLGETAMAPYGFIVNKDGSIQVSFYDMKEDIGVEKMVFKKVVK